MKRRSNAAGELYSSSRHLARLSILAGTFALLMVAAFFPARAQAVEDHVVNVNFEYPSINMLASGMTTKPNWFLVDPNAGKWYYYDSGRNTWTAIPGWDRSVFAWQSTQSAAPGVDHVAGAVEIQIDSSSGNQYAEMVASEPGSSVYQDVSTPAAGTVYRWSLRHASINRGFLDQMSVMIGAAGSEVAQNAIRDTANGNGDAAGFVGAVISTKVSNTTDRDHEGQWETYHGTYEVPEGQTVTRLSFRSVASPSGYSGNLLDDVAFAPAYPLFYDANAPAGSSVSGSVPATGKDANGIYQNYYTLSETPSLVDSASTGLTCTGADGQTYHLVGWSKTAYGLLSTPAELAAADLVTSYDGLVASGTDTQLNKVYAVWANDDAVAGTSTVTLGKLVSGSGAPSGATFSFDVSVAKADGTARTGIYAYTVSGGTGASKTGTLVLDDEGKGTISGVTAGQTITIEGLINGDTYEISEVSSTVDGVTTDLADSVWTTTWQDSRKLMIPLSSYMLPAVDGSAVWPRPVSSYLDPALPVGSSGVIADIPAIPAGTAVRLMKGTAAPLDPSKDADIPAAQVPLVVTPTVQSDGTLGLKVGGLYHLVEGVTYRDFFSRCYLYVDYTKPIHQGSQATGTVSPGCGAIFTNTYPDHKLSIGKLADGSGAPAGATFGYDILLTDAAGKPVTGTYDYTLTSADGVATTGKVTFDAGGKGTVSGIASGATLTIAGIPAATAYSVRETTVTSFGTETNLGGDWSASWSSDAEEGAPEHDGPQATGTLLADTVLSFHNTSPALLPLTISKSVTGKAAPVGATFSFRVTLSDSTGAPLSGDYTFVRGDGSKGVITLDEKGSALVDGVGSDDTVTILKVPADTRYTVAEEDATVGGTTSAVASDARWSSTSAESRSIVIPVNALTPQAVSGSYTWNTPLNYYLPTSAPAPSSYTIMNLPTMPAGSTVRLMKMKSTAPDPANDRDLTGDPTGASLLTASIDADGHLVYVTGKLYKLADSLAYRTVLSQFYLCVDYAYPVTAGTTATGSMDMAPVKVAFTNAYTPSPITFDIPLTKTVAGAEAPAEDYSFTLSALTEGAPMPASTSTTISADGAGTFTGAFGDATYTAPGTWLYTVTETVGSTKRMKYDPDTYLVAVSVTADPSGVLKATTRALKEASTTVVPCASFLNTYSKPGTWTPTVTKVLDGDSALPVAWPTFSFDIAADPATPTAPLPKTTEKTLEGTGSVAFDTIDYDAAGTYTYDLTEKPGDATGWTYDDATVKATVVVEADPAGGFKVSSVTWEKGGAAAEGAIFENSYAYEPVSWNMPLDLTVRGTGAPGETDSFTMTAVTEGAPLSSATSLSVPTTGVGSYTSSFPAITFDRPGTWVYRVVQAAGGASGMTYDTVSRLVTVTVSGNEDGTLSVESSCTVDDPSGQGQTLQTMSFVNVYMAPDDGIDLPATPAASSVLPRTGDALLPSMLIIASCLVGGCLLLMRRWWRDGWR